MSFFVISVFLYIVFLLSPLLIKWRWITSFQKEKLKILLFYRVPEEIIRFLLILIPIALFYLTVYFINGGLKRITEIDLSALTITFFDGWSDISYNDFGFKYSLSGWWNILFLSIWFNLMRYLYKIIYFKFPYSRIEYSSYLLLFFLTVVMVYFSYVGNSPLYGLVYNIILLIAYTLTHLLIYFLFWFFGINRI